MQRPEDGLGVTFMVAKGIPRGSAADSSGICVMTSERGEWAHSPGSGVRRYHKMVKRPIGSISVAWAG